jgi:predicted nuclease of restriction endonuclease-like (RecB) superfamily
VAKLASSEKVPQAAAKLPPLPISPQAAAKLPATENVQQSAAQLPDSLLWSIPWFHHIVLLQKVKDRADRLWYMQQTLANGWSRNVLLTMIQSQAHRRQGTALTNFERLLPPPQSDLARQTLKDPYIFDFLTLEEPLPRARAGDESTPPSGAIPGTAAEDIIVPRGGGSCFGLRPVCATADETIQMN